MSLNVNRVYRQFTNPIEFTKGRYASISTNNNLTNNHQTSITNPQPITNLLNLQNDSLLEYYKNNYFLTIQPFFYNNFILPLFLDNIELRFKETFKNMLYHLRVLIISEIINKRNEFQTKVESEWNNQNKLKFYTYYLNLYNEKLNLVQSIYGINPDTIDVNRSLKIYNFFKNIIRDNSLKQRQLGLLEKGLCKSEFQMIDLIAQYKRRKNFMQNNYEHALNNYAHYAHEKNPKKNNNNKIIEKNNPKSIYQKLKKHTHINGISNNFKSNNFNLFSFSKKEYLLGTKLKYEFTERNSNNKQNFYLLPIHLFNKYNFNLSNTNLILNNFIENMFFYKLYSIKQFINFYKKYIINLSILDKINFFIKMGFPNNIHFLNEWILNFDNDILNNSININNNNNSNLLCSNKNINKSKTKLFKSNKYQPNNLIRKFNKYQLLKIKNNSNNTSNQFFLLLSDLDFPQLIINNSIQNYFNNETKFYCFVDTTNNDCYVIFNMGFPFSLDFLNNFYNKEHNASYFFEFFINEIIFKRLINFNNIIFLGHSRGSEIAQMIAFYISIYYKDLLSKIFTLGTASKAWINDNNINRNTILSSEIFNEKLNGKFIIFGFFYIDFVSLSYDKKSISDRILPIYFDQFMFINSQIGYKFPKIFFLTKPFLNSKEERYSYSFDINHRLSHEITKKRIILNINNSTKRKILVDDCSDIAYNLCSFNIDYLNYIFNCFYSYLYSQQCINSQSFIFNEKINNFNLKLIRINDCKQQHFNNRNVFKLSRKCYHQWYPFYFNSLKSLLNIHEN